MCLGLLMGTMQGMALTLRLHDRPDHPLQIRNNRLAVFRDIKLDRLILVLRRAIIGQKVKGVVPACGKQNRSTRLALVAALGNLIGKVNELVNQLEKFGRVSHGGLS